MVLAANASSWSDRPARASVMASCTASLSSTVAVATVRRRRAPRRSSSRSSVPSLIVHHVGAGVVEQRDAGRHQDLRARGWGSAREIDVAALTTAAGRHATQRLGAAPGRGPRGR